VNIDAMKKKLTVCNIYILFRNE